MTRTIEYEGNSYKLSDMNGIKYISKSKEIFISFRSSEKLLIQVKNTYCNSFVDRVFSTFQDRVIKKFFNDIGNKKIRTIDINVIKSDVLHDILIEEFGKNTCDEIISAITFAKKLNEILNEPSYYPMSNVEKKSFVELYRYYLNYGLPVIYIWEDDHPVNKIKVK